MNSNPFKQATKDKAFLRLALSGIAGSGKTFTALNIARYLVPDGKIAVIDTEHGSARKYADLFKFDVVELSNFAPDTYVAMINAAAANGYAVLIIDSLSHAWVGDGGVLDMVNKATLASKSKNAYTEGWSKGTPAQNRLVDAILSAPCHVIATMRAKSDYIMVEGKDGKSAPKKIGLAPIQREGVEFEFDVVAEMNLEHALTVEKTRCSKLDGEVITKPGKEIAETLRAWLSDGVEPAQAQKPIVDKPQAPASPVANKIGVVVPDIPEQVENEIIDGDPFDDYGPLKADQTSGDHWWLDNAQRQQFWIANSRAGRNAAEVARLWGIKPSKVDKHDDPSWFDVAEKFENVGQAMADLYTRSKAQTAS